MVQALKGTYISPLDQLVDFLEALDATTHEKTNNNKHWLEGGWCPEESWPEGYLFAVELKRLFTATLDPIETVSYTHLDVYKRQMLRFLII